MESRDKEINLIAGRIIDEYRKHPDLNWSLIAAQKIYSQWNEYYNQQTKALTDEIEKLQSRISELEKANICPNCDGEIEAVDNDLIWTDVCVSIVNRENKQVPFTETLKYLKSKYTIKRNI